MEKSSSIPYHALWKGNYYLVFLFPWKFRLRKQIRGFKKLFMGNISLCLLNIVATAAHKSNKTFQKLYFNFRRCKLVELAGCFTPLQQLCTFLSCRPVSRVTAIIRE